MSERHIQIMVNAVVIFVGLLLLLACFLAEMVGYKEYSILIFGIYCFVVYKEYQKFKNE